VEPEKGSCESHSVEDSLWMRIQTFRHTDFVMNELYAWDMTSS